MHNFTLVGLLLHLETIHKSIFLLKKFCVLKISLLKLYLIQSLNDSSEFSEALTNFFKQIIIINFNFRGVPTHSRVRRQLASTKIKDLQKLVEHLVDSNVLAQYCNEFIRGE